MQVKEYNKTKKEIIQAHQLLFTHPNICHLAVFFPVRKAASQNLDLRDYHKDHKTSSEMLKLKRPDEGRAQTTAIIKFLSV